MIRIPPICCSIPDNLPKKQEEIEKLLQFLNSVKASVIR